MSDPFEKIDSVEIADLANILKQLEEGIPSDNGRLVAAQLMSAYRLVTTQHAAHKELIAGQDKAHKEILNEQRKLVAWQGWVTIATIIMAATTVYYAWTTRAVFLTNIEPVLAVSASEEQLEQGKAKILVRNAGSVPVEDIQIWTASVLYPINSSTAFELGLHHTLPTAVIRKLRVGEEFKLDVDLNSEIASLKDVQKEHGGGISYFTIQLFYRHGITAKRYDSTRAYLILNLVGGVRLMRTGEDPSVAVRMIRDAGAQVRNQK